MFGPWWSFGRVWGWGGRFGYFPWRGIAPSWGLYGYPYAAWPYYGSFGSYPYWPQSTYPYLWSYPPGFGYQGYPPYELYTPAQASSGTSEKEMLENELKYLQERIEDVRKRLEQFKD